MKSKLDAEAAALLNQIRKDGFSFKHLKQLFVTGFKHRSEASLMSKERLMLLESLEHERWRHKMTMGVLNKLRELGSSQE